jgi:hypothetical protein
MKRLERRIKEPALWCAYDEDGDVDGEDLTEFIYRSKLFYLTKVVDFGFWYGK